MMALGNWIRPKRNRARLAVRAFCSVMLALATQTSVNGQELSDLSVDEYTALEKVSEPSVTATISFLASDELKGRGTPSPEFNIAAAYVASRLRAAGATGLGPNGSYFVSSTIETTQVPAGGSVLVGESLVESALLSASDETVSESGPIPILDWDASEETQEFSNAVAIRLPDSIQKAPRPMRQVQSRLHQLGSQGATAVLLLVGEDCSLWADARSNAARPQLIRGADSEDPPAVLVVADDFDATGDYKLFIKPARKREVTIPNVVAVIPGSDKTLAEEAILFSAHLDHLGERGIGPDTIYNGADDDASGVTAVVTLADAFGALEVKPARSLLFVAYWGEERGLLGSKVLVEDSPWPLEKIIANVNIEMIGRPETDAQNKMWMTGWDKSDLGKLMNAGSRRVGVELFEHPQYSARLYRASDNYSFAKKSVVAHSFSAGSLHEDYHQPSDEWTKLNLPHMTQIIRGIYAASLPIANNQLTPQQTSE